MTPHLILFHLSVNDKPTLQLNHIIDREKDIAPKAALTIYTFSAGMNCLSLFTNAIEEAYKSPA